MFYKLEVLNMMMDVSNSSRLTFGSLEPSSFVGLACIIFIKIWYCSFFFLSRSFFFLFVSLSSSPPCLQVPRCWGWRHFPCACAVVVKITLEQRPLLSGTHVTRTIIVNCGGIQSGRVLHVKRTRRRGRCTEHSLRGYRPVLKPDSQSSTASFWKLVSELLLSLQTAHRRWVQGGTSQLEQAHYGERNRYQDAVMTGGRVLLWTVSMYGNRLAGTFVPMVVDCLHDGARSNHYGWWSLGIQAWW